MATTATLRIRFTGFWIAGTGASRGRHLDAVTHRDPLDLPAMPMTQIKGQLRETAERLAAARAAGWTPAEVSRLFGTRPEATDPLGGTETAPGGLGFRGEARLPEAVRVVLGADKDRRARLSRRLAATRIDPNGVADDKTLRAIEVSVPLTLEGIVAWIGPAPEPQWIGLLDAACAATLAFGKLKTHGYGRAIAECVP